MASAPPGCCQEAFQVLTRGDQEPLDVRVEQPPQAEPPQAMPLLRLGEERFHPDLALAHRLLVRLGGMVAPHPLHVRLVKAALDLSPLGAAGAPLFEQAGVAGRCRSLVEAHPFGVLVLTKGQQLAALVTPADVMENVPLQDLLWRVCFRRKIRPRQVTGDTTYGTVENIVAVEDAGIRASMPLPDFDARTRQARLRL
jgi:hypothetical protein